MTELIIDKLHDTKFLVALLTTVAAMATVITVAMPYVLGDNLERRMKLVALERGKIRARERERLARGERIAMFLIALLYLFVISDFNQPPMIRFAMAIGAAWLGIRLPGLFLKNLIQRRQTSIRRAFPDALDLLLICVESGMSIDAAFRKVSEEIGSQSIPLAEELTLTTAELSYLQDRRLAYDNLAGRTNIDGVKAVCTALVQAERYGTPLGQALRVLAQENRDMRMSEAEKKAAALPPKLTVPMILFFLPVLFIVILGPAAIRVMEINP